MRKYVVSTVCVRAGDRPPIKKELFFSQATGDCRDPVMQATPTKIVSNIMETHSDVGYIIWRGNNDVFGRVFQEAVALEVEGNLISLRVRILEKEVS